MTDTVVVDASVLVDLFIDSPNTVAARARLSGAELVAPAHVDVEVLSAVGRMSRDGKVETGEVADVLDIYGRLVVDRHPLVPLMAGAWARRANIQLADALYVELAAQLGIPLITTDRRLARATPLAEAIGS